MPDDSLSVMSWPLIETLYSSTVHADKRDRVSLVGHGNQMEIQWGRDGEREGCQLESDE